MSTILNISAVYAEFTAALTEVLAENAVGPARRGRLARARAAVKKTSGLQRVLDIFSPISRRQCPNSAFRV